LGKNLSRDVDLIYHMSGKMFQLCSFVVMIVNEDSMT